MSPSDGTAEGGKAARYIGPYRVDGELGSGGMGAVYRAFDERLERPVALKRIRTDSKGGSEVRERLLTEAKAIAQLSHPNIVQVYDFLVHDDVDWIVMELVEGRNLRSLVTEGSLSVKEVLRFAVEVAKGLAAAHGRGVIHRDLKTENVIVTDDDKVKILDFGLAKLSVFEMGAEGEGAASSMILGTPRSMAPEQALGNPVDHRADLFSFGVLIYECFVGESPFFKGRRGVFQVLSRVCNQAHEPISDLSQDVPRRLSDLVDQLLEKKPEDRPQGIEEVLVRLRRLAEAPSAAQRVLFVDDEPDVEPLVRQWFRREIRAGGLDVRFAGNGRQALEVLRDDPSIRLVFTDLNMPTMDGLTLISKLSELDRPCVAVVVSAFGDMGNIRSAMNLGAYDFLIKPIDFDDLKKTLDKAAEHAAWVADHLRLRAENTFLEERNHDIRRAFAAYLQGDPEIGAVVEPLLEQALDSKRRFRISLHLRVARLSEMAQAVPSGPFLDGLHRFLRETVALSREYAGTLVGLDLKGGRLALGFGALTARRVDHQRALDCAMELRGRVVDLDRLSRAHAGPPIACKIVVESMGGLGDGPEDSAAGGPAAGGPAAGEPAVDGVAPAQDNTVDSIFERGLDDEIYIVESQWLDGERVSVTRAL